MKNIIDRYYKFEKQPFLLIILIVLVAIFIDLSNLDSGIHKNLCRAIGVFFKTICPDFYDLPIWEVAVATGTIAAAYFAYAAIRESNKRLEVEQTPYVVLKDRIFTAGSGKDEHLDLISLKNIGKGSAVKITASSDPEGQISIIEGSNPHSIDLASGDYHNNWAIDEGQVVKGLAKQGKKIKSVIKDVPNEANLEDDEKDNADFYLFIWYENQAGNRYRTVVQIRHSGYFFKVMENKFEKVDEERE